MGTVTRRNAVAPNIDTSKISSVDALWSLIMQQGVQERRTLTERLICLDTKVAERYLLKSSIVKGWKQVKKMQNENTDNGTLQDLIDELK